MVIVLGMVCRFGVAIQKKNPKAIYCDNEKLLFKNLQKDKVIAFIGAGDINLVAEKLVRRKL
jgi:hypothetical protein